MNVVECSKCRKDYEEMELMWVKVNGKTELLCDNCAKKKGK